MEKNGIENKKKEPEIKNTIKINGEEVPIRCNLEIMAQLEEEFGTIMIFSEKLMHLNSSAGKENENILPDMRAITFALPKFVHEGIEYYNEKNAHSRQLEQLLPSTVLRHCEDPVVDVARILWSELWRSMAAPKQQPPAETSQN